MINLPNITLVALTSVRIPQTIQALEYSCREINFGSVKILSDIQPNSLPEFIKHEFTEKSSNIDEWNYNVIYNLPNHIETDFALLIHDNGFVVFKQSTIQTLRSRVTLNHGKALASINNRTDFEVSQIRNVFVTTSFQSLGNGISLT